MNEKMFNYELIYNIRLKQVLNDVGIRPIDVLEEDFKHLRNPDKALYFVTKALDFYKDK